MFPNHGDPYRCVGLGHYELITLDDYACADISYIIPIDFNVKMIYNFFNRKENS